MTTTLCIEHYQETNKNITKYNKYKEDNSNILTAKKYIKISTL